MIAITAMTVLCTGAIAFYFRFLFALLMECKYDWICYLMRLRGESKNIPYQSHRETKRQCDEL